MYIVNFEDLNIEKEKLFITKDKILSKWLIETCKIPLLARTKDDEFVFMKTEEFNKFMSITPFWYDILGLIA